MELRFTQEGIEYIAYGLMFVWCLVAVDLIIIPEDDEDK